MEPDCGFLMKMADNFRAAIGDPLAFRSPEELEFGVDAAKAKRMQSFAATITGVFYLLNAERLARKQGHPGGGRVDLEKCYQQSTLELQAGLLMAYFGAADLKDQALEFLAEWFGDCDLRADRATIGVYLEESKAYVDPKLTDLSHVAGQSFSKLALTVLERWDSTKAAEIKERRIRQRRTEAGVCLQCGKPLDWKQKLFGSKSHKGCTVFVE
jgi:hypothetical protein